MKHSTNSISVYGYGGLNFVLTRQEPTHLQGYHGILGI